ncbi:hypothetical protein BDN71DRAFT_1502280 [Pleurotus eryngii]|uniref:Fungal-type protein kinase domain-containing protein n=1 Tax=Pleurotus eryngii TaxID=5323 RepID=A0A9P6A542_PLEER|nr:hypothetical protein BDN71DRAFT_1502280 [Pleurotus eryngii]
MTDGSSRKISTRIGGFVSVQTATADAVRLLRDRLRKDGKITRVPQFMVQRLRLDSVDEAFVRSCRDACVVECAKSIDELETLATKADLPRGVGRQRDEKKMYPSLAVRFPANCKIVDTSSLAYQIRKLCDGRSIRAGLSETTQFSTSMPSGQPPTYNRLSTHNHRTLQSGEHLANAQPVDTAVEHRVCRPRVVPLLGKDRHKDEEHTAGFPLTYPDGAALERDCTPDSFYWRDIRAFVECKASTLQGEPSRTTTVPETVVQGADYVRLHLSADPFRVFSVGLLIYGFRFMAAIFDQDGVCLSDPYHLRNNPDVFIRVVYQLGHGLSDVELGHNPTVEQSHLPEGSQPRKALDDLAEKQGMPNVSKDFPSYKITLKTSDIHSMDGATKRTETDETTWVTIGPPIWSPPPYCGRGTTVWRVVAMHGSDIPRPWEVLILKNAWRRSHRDSESSIYVTLRRAMGADPLCAHRKGIAEFRVGADVAFPGRDEVISVNNLRYLFLGGFIPPPAPQTPVLHRLILAMQVRALWYCESLRELLRGMGAALRGHKFLVSKGILHRDISAGNIMLSSLANPPDGMEGFLMDLEYARLNTVTKIHAMKIAPEATTSATHTVFKDAKRGAEMTGTLQFMAAELLEALEKGKAVRHEVHHDLESFVWVLAYAVSRHLQRRSGLGEAVKAELRQHFVRSYGRFLFADINDARISLRPLRPPSVYEEMLP